MSKWVREVLCKCLQTDYDHDRPGLDMNRHQETHNGFDGFQAFEGFLATFTVRSCGLADLVAKC